MFNNAMKYLQLPSNDDGVFERYRMGELLLT